MKAEKIRDLRLKLGLIQKEMAEVLGFQNESRISELENGKTNISPQVATHVEIMFYFWEIDKEIVKKYIKQKLKGKQ